MRGALPLVVALGILAAACSPGGNKPAAYLDSGAKLSIVTTLYPLEYFARRIGGQEVTVANLIPPGVEAHSFEPTPADIRRLDAADVIIYNGSGFEPWMGRALGAIGSKPRIVVEASLSASVSYSSTTEQDAPGLDPHVFLDPLKAIQQVELIGDAMSKADLARASVYAANAQALAGELSALHQRFAAGLGNCRQDSFVTSHRAFGHLAERYGLRQVSISGLSPEAEPEPAELASIADIIEKLGVRYIMVEPLSSAELAETLAMEVGATILPLHPLESITPDESRRGEDYFTLMDTNLQNLRLALECQP